jgi:DNA repair photolyase
LAWIARTIDTDRIDLHPDAVALANAAGSDLHATLPRHASILALANHAANKILYLATAWAIASQVPLQGEQVRVTEREVQAVLPLYIRTLMAWTTRGVAEAFDPARVAEVLELLRGAARSRGRKQRIDPLKGLRVLRSAPIGLTMVEWSARVGASDKTIRDAWVTPLFEPHELVERAATRYRITPLGRAVLAAAEDQSAGADSGPAADALEHTDDVHVEVVEVASSDAVFSLVPEERIAGDAAGRVLSPAREIPENTEVRDSARMGQHSSIIPPGVTVQDFQPRPEDGTLRPIKVIFDEREKDHALGETGGFLRRYTHTLNPAVGCVFGSSACGAYCYAQWETPARLVASHLGVRWGEFLFVKARIPEALERDLERAARRDVTDPRHVSRLRIFMSSCTEPCAGPALPVTRECLRVFARYPIGRLVLQTRSPRVVELLPELEALDGRALVSLTVESDSDAIWKEVEPPLLPRLRDRRKAAELLHARGVALSVTVSPCARLADPEEFAGWIAANSSYAVVDTFTAGDGKGGTRTEKTSIPSLFATHGWIWNDETAARTLYEKLRALMGDQVGWSKDGFNRLAEIPLACS